MLLRVHVVPARRDRFEVRVGAAIEELARRLAGGLAAAPRLAGGEGRASRAARSDYCERQRHCFAAVCSVQRERSNKRCDFETQVESCAVQMCSMGVRCRQATAMLSNDSSQACLAGLASVLQAASKRLFSAVARARDDPSAVALFDCRHRGRGGPASQSGLRKPGIRRAITRARTAVR